MNFTAVSASQPGSSEPIELEGQSELTGFQFTPRVNITLMIIKLYVKNSLSTGNIRHKPNEKKWLIYYVKILAE